MIDFLLGVPGKLKAIATTLATYLDATVSSRAPASTALSTATWTGTRAAALDGKVLSDTDPVISPPISTGWQTPTGSVAIPPSALSADTLSHTLAAAPFTTTSTSYVDVVNVTGKGVLNFLVVGHSTAYAGNNIELIIDGVTIFSVGSTTPHDRWTTFVGSLNPGDYSVGLDQIPFRTSLQIRCKMGGSGTMSVVSKYRRTA